MVTRQVDPPVLGGHERATEHQAADDCRCQHVEAGGLPAHLGPLGRQDIAGGAYQRPSEIDEHVHTKECQPDHRRRTMETPGDLKRVSVEEPHRDSAAEQNDGRHDEQRRQQTHRRLRRAVRHIGVAARVVAREAPAGADQLQDDRRDQREAYEDVPRHERVHAEQDGRHLDEDRSQQEHSQ